LMNLHSFCFVIDLLLGCMTTFFKETKFGFSTGRPYNICIAGKRSK